MQDWPAGLARRLDRTGLQWQESNKKQFVSFPLQTDSSCNGSLAYSSAQLILHGDFGWRIGFDGA
jgi:hypothetical protein